MPRISKIWKGGEKLQFFRQIKRFLKSKGYKPVGWKGISNQLQELLGKSFTGNPRAIAFHCYQQIQELNIEIAKNENNILKEKLKKNQRLEKSQQEQQILDFYCSYEWRRIRFKILQKYGRKCLCCGSETRPLHVDHIKPLRFNWNLRLSEENLQVLCELCNHGKGNWSEEDFRPKEPLPRIRLVKG